MNTANLLARNSRKYPNATAVVSSETRITYQELNQLVNQLAHSLLKRGIAKEDKIVIFMPNVIEFIISYFAVQQYSV